jgi:hypothetical protein
MNSGDGVFGFKSGDLISVLADLKSWEVIRKLQLDESKNKVKDTYSFSYVFPEIEALEPEAHSHTLGDRVINELSIYGYNIRRLKSYSIDNKIIYEFNILSRNANCLSEFIKHIQNIDNVIPGFLPSVPSLIKALTSNGSATRVFSALEQGLATIHVDNILSELNSKVGVIASVVKNGNTCKSFSIMFEPKLVFRFGKIVEPSKLQSFKSGCWIILS